MRVCAVRMLGLVGLAACGGPDTHVDDSDDSDDSDVVAAETDSDGHSDVDTDAVVHGLTGVVVDAEGRPLAETTVLACTSAFCLQGESGPAGRFAFDFEPPVMVAVKTHEDLEATPRRGAALLPCVLVEQPDLDVGEVYAPDLPDGVDFPETSTPSTVTAGDGLELTLRRRDVTPAFGDRLNDLAASRLPDQRVPAYPDLVGEEVVAVYALHPFAATSSVPIPVRAPSNLPADTVVHFRTVSEIDGSFVEVATGHADGTHVVTDDGAGITHLSYLVISR